MSKENSTCESKGWSFGPIHSNPSLGLEQRGVAVFMDQKWTQTYAVRVGAKNEKENSCWGVWGYREVQAGSRSDKSFLKGGGNNREAWVPSVSVC